jgi:hypothetical protein
LNQAGDISDQFFRLRDPWQNLSFLKADEVDVVTLLSSLKKIIVCPGQILRDFTCPHIVPIEEATDARVFRRGEAIMDKKSRDGIEAGIVEAIYTRIPPFCSSKNASIFESLICSFHTVLDKITAPFRHSLVPSCWTLW